MRKYKLFLFVFVFTLLFTFSLKSVSAVTVSSNCTINSTLRIGSTGDEVACLQLHLGLISDGKFGPRTQIVVKAFQANAGLSVDGVVGPRSIQALEVSNSVTPTPISVPTSTTIQAPIIKITFPTAGVTLVEGKTYNITWMSSTNDTYGMYLENNQAGSIRIGDTSSLSNSFSWKVPSILSYMNGGDSYHSVAPTDGYRISFTSGTSAKDMKQYFSSIFKIIPNNSSSLISGCTSTSGYSSTTGMACDGSTPITPIPTPTPVSTCVAGGFDSNTGFRCGCTSASGYNSIDGTSCSPTPTSSITVLSPNGGETFVQNGNLTGSFTTTLPVGTNYEVALVSYGGSFDSGVSYGSINTSGGTVAFSFTIPNGALPGNMYKVRVMKMSSCGGDNPCVQDLSDNYFSIASAPTPISTPISTCTSGGFDSNTGFRCGCTSVLGFSSVDGGSCGSASNFKPGCTSYSGYSSVNGESCAIN